MKLGKAIDAVGEAETELAQQLRAVGERHAAEADLYHLGHTLARACAERLERLRPFAERYGTKLDDSSRTVQPPSGELLLDLHVLYLAAQSAEITWTMLAQAARAARDAELVEVAGECQEEAELCGKWVRTRIKETAPQVYATG